jgi:hypothetical protein
MDWGSIKIRNWGLISPDRWNWLVDQVRSALVQDFVGGTWARDPGGTTLYSAPGQGGGGSATHPFKVLMRPKGESEGEYEAKVVLESTLYKSLRPNDKQAITGLDTWFPLIGNDAIWLGVIFDENGEITFAQIDSWGSGDAFAVTQDAWSGENGYCEDDGGDPPAHQASRKLIAYSIAGDSGEPVLTQVMFHDQVLRDVNIDGRPARYPFDHEGGYPL